MLTPAKCQVYDRQVWKTTTFGNGWIGVHIKPYNDYTHPEAKIFPNLLPSVDILQLLEIFLNNLYIFRDLHTPTTSWSLTFCILGDHTDI